VITLRVVPREGEPFEWTPRGDAAVVGRALECDLVISDAFLSRHHARLVLDRRSWCIEDMGSRNGTHVNGERVEGRRPLAPGDVVTVSGSTLEVHDADRLQKPPPVADGGVTTGDTTYFRSARELLESEHEVIPAADGAAEGAADVRRWAERLRVINEMHRDLGRSVDLEELLERLLARVFDHLRPERGVVYLRRPDGDGFEAAASRAAAPGAEPLHSTHLLREVAEKGLAALISDARTDLRFAEAHSLLDLGVRSLVAAPLLEGDSSLGMIALDASVARRRFQHEDLELLVSLSSAAALRIRNLSLTEEAAERRRLESELALARRIQVALLPQDLPAVEGWSVHGGNLPSRGVSGDFYEVVERTGDGGGELVLVIADVSGKGMAASLLTASLEALLAPLIAEGEEVDAVCTFASRLLFERTPPEKYATAILAVVDTASGRLSYTVAGHNPALLVRAGGTVEELGSTGPPLGLLPSVVYAAGEVALAAGDTLVLYTDGLVEAVDPDDEEYGLERAAEICRRHAGADPGALARALEEDVEAFVHGVPFADDRTLLIVRRTA